MPISLGLLLFMISLHFLPFRLSISQLRLAAYLQNLVSYVHCSNPFVACPHIIHESISTTVSIYMCNKRHRWNEPGDREPGFHYPRELSKSNLIPSGPRGIGTGKRNQSYANKSISADTSIESLRASRPRRYATSTAESRWRVGEI